MFDSFYLEERSVFLYYVSKFFVFILLEDTIGQFLKKDEE
jgi:hypothetical protein